jgi:hypothetical protein
VCNRRFKTEALRGLFSFHDAGIQVVMGDGSVRTVENSINPVVLCDMVTKNGNELITDGN